MVAEPTILLATTNPGKLREVKAVLAGLPVRLVGLADFPDMPEPVEDAPTFEGNARIKALYYADQTGVCALADDSGLEVDALDGAPGVHSARYAGVGAGNAANNAKLIEALQSTPQERRTARFRCVVVLARAKEVLAVGRGAIEGVIIDEPRGANGFGYDPHFFVPSLGRTTAELPPEHKNRISHRGRALADILPHLRALLTAEGGCYCF